jgi:DNA helicase-2/ATP-dependent DNA helicase PcrA
VFRKSNIPYRIYGGLSFFQRKEVKDVIAYLRLMTNSNDEEAFKRIVNYPARGIGATTISKLMHAAHINEVSMWTVAKNAADYETGLGASAQKKLTDFVLFVEGYAQKMESSSAYEIALDMVEQSGIIRDLQQNEEVEAQAKLENIQELLNAIQEYELDMMEERGVERISIGDYLSQVALLTDADEQDDGKAKVTLMTVHAAKGLEFDTVFITGMEDGLFPSQNAQYSEREIEEERRLFYVAVTRAKRACYLTFAKSRFKWGKTEFCSISPFVSEIDSRYLNDENNELRLKTTNENRGTEHVKPMVSERKSINSLQGNAVNLTRFKKINQQSTSAATSSKTDTMNSLQPANSLKAGAIVEHDCFGIGTVVSTEGAGDNAKAVVNFTSAGVKTLLLRFAKISVLS